MAWSLPEMECLTLYYDSVEELGQLACFQWFYFASSGGQSQIECVGRGNAKISAVRSLADICFLHDLIRLIRCIMVSVCVPVFKRC